MPNSVDRIGHLPDRRQSFPYQIMEVFHVIRPQSRSGGSQSRLLAPNRSLNGTIVVLALRFACCAVNTNML
jgi:hypothetical protein